MKKIKSVQNALEELIPLLDRECARDWMEYFSRILNESRNLNADQELKDWARQITNVYRGMASFSDLVIVEGWTPLKIENNKLDELRTKLLVEAMKLIEA